MKKLLDVSLRGLTLVCFVLLLSCGSDDDSETPPAEGNDPNDFCSVELCSSLANLKQICIDEYNDCVATGALTNQECQVFATETCTL